jgi:hypothetical protein
MIIWTFVCRYDGDLSVSTHFTQKGALLTGIGDVLDYLGITEEQLAEMNSEQLIKVYQLWSERTWDHFNYESEVIKTKVAG